jgi:hypothetical protein
VRMSCNQTINTRVFAAGRESARSLKFNRKLSHKTILHVRPSGKPIMSTEYPRKVIAASSTDSHLTSFVLTFLQRKVLV